MGAKSKYTDATMTKIIEAIKMGASYTLAAGYAGITYETLRDWMHTKPAFSVAVKEAQGQAALIWLAKIERAASEGAWQAAAWKLERLYPQEYGKTVQEQQHSGEQRLVIEHVNDWRKHGTTPPPTDGEGGAS